MSFNVLSVYMYIFIYKYVYVCKQTQYVVYRLFCNCPISHSLLIDPFIILIPLQNIYWSKYPM